ncbi:hypothetical protein EV385_6616 [Krasilnikovia cinnamomea]|uniref:Uncharacterized protein n=1 Tax=Krasilnikovia cinnamomea TaxID=349313 RepID=A0A4Q7Z7Q2_9ACTN|nr:hypothetical protein [Krasilnikovia cinnamomea]RZU46542.1 hypothetical protein EV385_6616 [Krasilnikovia cinnamomea]
MDLADRRSAAQEAPPLPEEFRYEPVQKFSGRSGRQSGPGITIGDIPGDWGSVHAVWTGTPEPLSALTEQVRAARDADDPRQVAMACWSLLVLIPRAVLHLASWALQDPARTAAALLLLGVLVGSLTL